MAQAEFDLDQICTAAASIRRQAAAKHPTDWSRLRTLP
jgi:hypothetical protein